MVHPVGEVHVEESRGAEHRSIALRLTAVTVTCRVFGTICLGLDNPSRAVTDAQHLPEQVLRDDHCITGKERPGKAPHSLRAAFTLSGTGTGTGAPGVVETLTVTAVKTGWDLMVPTTSTSNEVLPQRVTRTSQSTMS